MYLVHNKSCFIPHSVIGERRSTIHPLQKPETWKSPLSSPAYPTPPSNQRFLSLKALSNASSLPCPLTTTLQATTGFQSFEKLAISQILQTEGKIVASFWSSLFSTPDRGNLLKCKSHHANPWPNILYSFPDLRKISK